MIGQLLLDGILSLNGKGRAARLVERVLHVCRRGLLMAGDPAVRYRLHGHELRFPLSHALPYILKAYPHYSANVGRIARYVQGKYPGLSVIDIGANVGDTIAMVRREAPVPLLCIEGDASFYDYLTANAAGFSDVTTVQAFLGEERQVIHGQVAKKMGTAHVALAAEAPAIEIRTLTEVLEPWPAFRHAKLLKSDTDGFDGRILRGARTYLQAARPVLFFEYDPDLLADQGDDGLALLDELAGLGYQWMLVYDNFGDYVTTVELSDRRIVSDLHAYVAGRGSARYWDLCLLHADDADLAMDIRASELAYFQQVRQAAG